MICHICHSEAVGQCKDCGRFYCPDHGDIVCVKCRTSTSPPGKPDVMVISDLPKAGPACYLCQGAATGSCPSCGKFYCPEHGGKDPGPWGGRRSLCDPCHEGVAARGKVGCLIMAFVLLIGFLLLCLAPSPPPRQPVQPPVIINPGGGPFPGFIPPGPPPPKP
jgi:hypothetical protein